MTDFLHFIFPFAPETKERKLAREILATLKGGEGSGNFGHAGRPGEVGGSASNGSNNYSKYMGVDSGVWSFSKSTLERMRERDNLISNGDFGTALNDENIAREIYGYYNYSYNDWQNNLTDEERNALKNYSTEYYRIINEYARTGNLPSVDLPGEEGEMFTIDMTRDQAQATVDAIDRAIAKSSLKDNVYVYRGLEGVNLSKGDVFVDNGFTSTSLSRDIAESHGFNFGTGSTIIKMQLNKGDHAAFVSHKNVGKNDYEFEMLLPRQSEFEVIGVENYENGTIYIVAKK